MPVLANVRRFFTGRVPAMDRVVLVESGSRSLYENLLPVLYRNLGSEARLDLVTCYPGLPAAFRSSQGSVYRIGDFQGRGGRGRLFRTLASNRYTAMGIICSGEPIMTKWKWAFTAGLPAKVFILNENGDYFWLDRTNWRTALHFITFRSGLSGAGAVSSLARLAAFPFSLLYLLLFAAAVHLRRKVQA